MNLLSKTSNAKLDYIDNLAVEKLHRPLHPTLVKLIDDMSLSFGQEIDLVMDKPIELDKLRKHFQKFDQTLNNVVGSKFSNDVENMNVTYAFKLMVNKDTIKINFLSNSEPNNINLMASILHALNTFCYLFPYNYDNLIINICLDQNARDIDITNEVISDIFEHQRKISGAFNVSGVTYRQKKIIDLTKSEEVIKLMYHEMVHFIGLDSVLLNESITSTWATMTTSLNLSEAYAEFMAIILHAAYISLHLSTNQKFNRYEIYEKILDIETVYSIYLTANILKFYGYNDKTFTNFFQGIGEKKYCPIFIWEYVIVRTKFLIDLDGMADLFRDGWRIGTKQVGQLVKYAKTDNSLINELSFFMEKTKSISNISYTIIDMDWRKIN